MNHEERFRAFLFFSVKMTGQFVQPATGDQSDRPHKSL